MNYKRYLTTVRFQEYKFLYRKVYAILMVQLAITVGFISLFVYEPNVKLYSRQHPEMWWIAFTMTFVLLIVLACCNDFRRRWPLNIILLGLFTACEGFMLGAVSSLYRVRLNKSLSYMSIH
jgi:FtsH-binding integral membrane protein